VITPCLNYADAPAAVEFLCAAFGFERHLVVAGAPGKILHAQLVCGDAMVMLSSAGDGPGLFRMVTPAAAGNVVTCCMSMMVADPDAHHAQALAAGAKIILGPHDNDYGGRGYECFDCEGNVWSFGSYDPWAVVGAPPHQVG
jgi:uncharacterized glyoxalase superfamily protein PhnB